MWNKFASTIILISLISTTSAYAQKTHPRLEPFKQLLGSWETSSSNGRMIEIWKFSDPNSFSGKSIKVGAGNDTTFLEEIKILVKGDDLMYVPTVSGQNSGKSVEFKLAGSIAGKYVFENKLHDFPQRIVYWLKSENEFLAWIEGDDQGESKKFEFKYQRIR